jgi:type IV secretory pathway TrbF-like protein
LAKATAGGEPRKDSVAAVAIALLATVFMAALPIFSPTIGQAITGRHIGDPMAVASIILAVGGFGTTIWQLSRTATALPTRSRTLNLGFAQ